MPAFGDGLGVVVVQVEEDGPDAVHALYEFGRLFVGDGAGGVGRVGYLVDVVADAGDVRAEGGRVGGHAHGVHAAVHEHVACEPHVGGVAASSLDQVVQLS